MSLEHSRFLSFFLSLSLPLSLSRALSSLSRITGHVVSEGGIAGTPLVAIVGYVPVMDSFGLETDMRIHTQGMAFCTQTFNHWDVVPGDPLVSERAGVCVCVCLCVRDGVTD